MVKVTETITRDCCLSKDLKPYLGEMADSVKRTHPVFCIYCGQIWVNERKMDAAGSTENVAVKYLIN